MTKLAPNKIYLYSATIISIIISFFCTDPVKPDFSDPPEISDNGLIQTFGKLDIDSTFGLCINLTGTAPFTFQWHKNDILDTTATKDTLLFESLSFSDSHRFMHRC